MFIVVGVVGVCIVVVCVVVVAVCVGDGRCRRPSFVCLLLLLTLLLSWLLPVWQKSRLLFLLLHLLLSLGAVVAQYIVVLL